MVVHTNAQIVTKPSVPTFTIALANHPHYVERTYGVDQYTGATIVRGGYSVDNKTIDVSINNQQFTSFVDSKGNQVNLYYNIRVKGHFGQDLDWKELYSPYSQIQREGVQYTCDIGPIQSATQNTVISIPANYPSNSQLDIQVQALEGYYTQYYPYAGVSGYGWRFTGEASDWSNTQAITIDESTPLITPNASLPPQSVSPPEIQSSVAPSTSGPQSVAKLSPDWTPIAMFALLVIIAVLLVFAVVFLYKRRVKEEKR